VLPARKHAGKLEPGAMLELLPCALAIPPDEVDLGAVAGRKHDRLDTVTGELCRELDRVTIGQEEPLAHLERCVMVRHADREQALSFMRVRTGHDLGRCYLCLCCS